MTVHRFGSTGEAYNASQTHDEIRDGDVLVVAGERWNDHDTRRYVAVMVSAWPTSIDSEFTGEFHALADDLDWETFDGGKYAESAKVARAQLGMEER